MTKINTPKEPFHYDIFYLLGCVVHKRKKGAEGGGGVRSNYVVKNFKFQMNLKIMI